MTRTDRQQRTSLSDRDELAKGGSGNKHAFLRHLVNGSIGGTLLMGVSRVLGVVTVVLLARLLGPEDYGVYAFVMAVVALLAIPVQLGLPNLVFRLVALYEHDREWPLLRGLLMWSNRWTVLVGLTIVMLGCLFLIFDLPLPRQLPAEPLVWGFGLLPLFGLSAVRAAALRGLRRPVIGLIPESLVQPALLPLLVLTAVWAGAVLDPALAVQLTVAAAAVGFLTGATLLAYRLPKEVRIATPQIKGAQWARAAVPFFVSFGAHLLLRNTDLVMLGMLATPEETGIYRVASQAALLVAFFTGVVHPLVGPYITRFYRSGDLQRLQQIVTAGSWLATLGALPLIVIYILGGVHLLEYFFGEEYAAGYHSLLILSASHFLYCLMTVAGPLLGMTGHAWQATIAILTAALLNALLNLFLVPKIGMEGAAIATLLSVIVMHVMLGLFGHRCTGVNVLKMWPLEWRALNGVATDGTR